MNELHGIENYPKGACQYKEGGASYYICKVLDTIDVHNKRVGVIGSENPWIEAILYNYGCRNIVTIEYNKPIINHENFKVIDFDEFVKTDDKFDYIISFSSIEHSGLGRYGDEINPDGDIETMHVIYDKLKHDGKMIIGIPIGLDTLVWNANRIYGKIRLPMILERFRIKSWVGGDESCLDTIPMFGGIYSPQPILICDKVN
jgi:SAM-dependent methyltransferase